MKTTKKDNKNYVLWSDVNKDFTKAKSIVYELLGNDIDGDHSVNMDFHFILSDDELKMLEAKLGKGETR